MNLLKNWLVSLLNKITILIVTRKFRSDLNSVQLTRLGSAYGGWWIPQEYLQTIPKKRLLISAGLGHDVTFDVEMLRAGYKIIGLDPTEGAFTHASRMFLGNPEVTIIQNGLWTSSGTTKFYKPKVEGYDSFSITNSQNQADYLQLETITIGDVFDLYIEDNDFETKILKMDIEGAEVHVLSQMLEHGIAFDFVAAEIDYLSLIPFRDIRRRITAVALVSKLLKKMKSEGYALVKYEHYNFFWIDGKLPLAGSN
jgi:FkbM family methyltransferase